jgi:hypothetical protein
MFDNEYSAMNYEALLHNKFDVANNPMFVNRHSEKYVDYILYTLNVTICDLYSKVFTFGVKDIPKLMEVYNIGIKHLPAMYALLWGKTNHVDDKLFVNVEFRDLRLQLVTLVDYTGKVISFSKNNIANIVKDYNLEKRDDSKIHRLLDPKDTRKHIRYVLYKDIESYLYYNTKITLYDNKGEEVVFCRKDIDDIKKVFNVGNDINSVISGKEGHTKHKLYRCKNEANRVNKIYKLINDNNKIAYVSLANQSEVLIGYRQVLNNLLIGTSVYQGWRFSRD